nr:hypothetical protein [Tanacetum cinerariifolium]
LEIENFKRSRENKIEFPYDYGNLNASYVNKKINFEDDYFHVIINPDFEKIHSPFQQTSSLKPYVPNVILEKIIIDLEDEIVNLLEKDKANLKIIESLKSKGFESSENAISETENQSENDCHVVEKECDNVENLKVTAPGIFKLNLDTSSSVRRPKYSGVIWKKKGSSNTSNVDLRDNSAFICNDAMNVSCNSWMSDLLDDNNFFIFDDESVRISPVSKIPFRKKPRDSMNIVQICLWIIDSGCSKHMTSNRALLTNFVEKSKEKVVVSSDYEVSEADDFSELKKITALLAKAFNRRKFYSKPTNNNLRTSSSSQSANKKQEFVKSDDKKVEKKADEKRET